MKTVDGVIKCGEASQIVRYAKKWFKRGDIIEDLKKLVSEYTFIDISQVEILDIRTILIGIAQDLGCFNDFMSTFVDDISPEMYYRFTNNGIKYMNKPHPDYNFDKAVIFKCLGMISMVQCNSGGKVLVEIDEPDYSILPKRDD